MATQYSNYYFGFAIISSASIMLLFINYNASATGEVHEFAASGTHCLSAFSSLVCVKRCLHFSHIFNDMLDL